MPTELSPAVDWIELSGVNAFLVDDDGTLTLVDTGMPWHATAIQRAVAEAGHAVADIERVLLTHYDLDHVGGLGRLGLDAEVVAGRADAAIIRGAANPSLRSRKGLFQRVMGVLVREYPAVQDIADGDTIGSFTAYHTPGHTPGHTAYVSESLGVAVLGDLVRESDGRLAASPWIISADTGQVRESIRTLAAEAPPFEVACMGHGVPFSEGGTDHLRALADRL